MTDRPFHPIADKYPLLSDEKLAEMAEDINANGQLHPIIFLRGKILDGRNRWLACALAGVKPVVEQYDGDTSEEALEAFVASCNDHRRHEAEETVRERKRTTKEKREAIAEALEANPNRSNRQIAEEAGVHHDTVKPVREELERRGGIATSETTTDTKGRQQPKKKPKGKELWCSRCINIGKQVVDCKACKTTREEAETKAKKKKGKKKPAAREELKDRNGSIVPDSLRDVFADHQLSDLITQLQTIESSFKPAPLVERAGKLCPHYGFILIEAFRDAAYGTLEQLQLAIAHLVAGLPHAVCPKCNGVDSRTADGWTCKGCRGYGYVPETRWTELAK